MNAYDIVTVDPVKGCVLFDFDIAPLIVGFTSLHKAIEFFQESIEEGAKRTQAHTMSLVAYGSEGEAQRMGLRSASIAHDYGLDPTTTKEQMAQMRMTMPRSFTNDQLATLFENESVYAHTTGMTPDAVGRLNYALQQISASSHLMGQDLNQVINASPALVKGLVDMHHLNGTKDLLDYYKQFKGSQVITDAVKVMTPTEQQRHLAQPNIIAERGRFEGAQKNAMGALFDGYDSHLTRLYQSLENLFGTSGLFTDAGHVLGYFMDRLSDIIDVMSTVAMNVHGYIFLIEEYFNAFWNKLSPETQHRLEQLGKYWNDFFDLLLAALALRLGVKGAAAIASKFGLTSAAESTVASTVASTAGGAAAGSAATAATVAGLVGLPLLMAGLVGYLSSSDEQKQWLKDYDANRTTSSDYQYGMVPHPSLSAPAQSYNYGQPQPQKVVVQQAPIEFKPVDVNLRLPDGTVQRVALEMVQQYSETQMMSAQGLGGDWQSAGKNAGWSPSELLRTK